MLEPAMVQWFCSARRCGLRPAFLLRRLRPRRLRGMGEVWFHVLRRRPISMDGHCHDGMRSSSQRRTRSPVEPVAKRYGRSTGNQRIALAASGATYHATQFAVGTITERCCRLRDGRAALPLSPNDAFNRPETALAADCPSPHVRRTTDHRQELPQGGGSTYTPHPDRPSPSESRPTPYRLRENICENIPPV